MAEASDPWRRDFPSIGASLLAMVAGLWASPHATIRRQAGSYKGAWLHKAGGNGTAVGQVQRTAFRQV